LPERIPRKQENSDRDKRNEGEEHEARFYRREKQGGDGGRNAPRHRRFSKDKRPRQKFDEAKETSCEKETTNGLGSNSHFSANRLTGEKKNSDENQSQSDVRTLTDGRRREKDWNALPGQEEQSATSEPEEMLDDDNGTEITEYSQHQQQKTWVNKVPPTNMNQFAAGKFKERRRKVSPCVQVRDGLKRNRKSPPRRPREESDDQNPGSNP
jgi:hypothetical protein